MIEIVYPTWYNFQGLTENIYCFETAMYISDNIQKIIVVAINIANLIFFKKHSPSIFHSYIKLQPSPFLYLWTLKYLIFTPPFYLILMLFLIQLHHSIDKPICQCFFCNLKNYSSFTNSVLNGFKSTLVLRFE